MRSKQALAGLVTVALAAGLAPAGKKNAPPPEFAPLAGQGEDAARLDGSTWLMHTGHFAARLQKLDDENRWDYLRERFGAATDPFADTDPSSPGFITFLLQLESKSDGAIVIQPQRFRLKTNLAEFRHPLDMPMIETTYSLIEAEVPAAYRAVAPALLDGEIVLHPGQETKGLLVYRGIKESTRSYVVEILVTTPKGEIEEFVAAYKRVKNKKKKNT